MLIPMPFPTCTHCGKVAGPSYHSVCSNQLFIETDTGEIHCPTCHNHWDVRDSNYYCTCGHSFTAEEMITTLNRVLSAYQICVGELQLQDDAKHQRAAESQSSLTLFLMRFLQKFGYAFGVTGKTAVSSAVSLLIQRD